MSIAGASSSTSPDSYSVDNAGVEDALALISKSRDSIEALYNEQLEQEKEDSAKYDTIKSDIDTSFSEIPEDEQPLDDGNFNIIINSLVVNDGEDAVMLTEDATNHLRSVILATLDIDPDTDLKNLTEVDAEQFKNVLAQIMLDYGGEDGVLSVEEFAIFAADYGFEGQISEELPEEEEEASDSQDNNSEETEI